MAANFSDPYRQIIDSFVESVHSRLEISRVNAIVMEVSGIDLQEFVRATECN